MSITIWRLHSIGGWLDKISMHYILPHMRLLRSPLRSAARLRKMAAHRRCSK